MASIVYIFTEPWKNINRDQNDGFSRLFLGSGRKRGRQHTTKLMWKQNYHLEEKISIPVLMVTFLSASWSLKMPKGRFFPLKVTFRPLLANKSFLALITFNCKRRYFMKAFSLLLHIDVSNYKKKMNASKMQQKMQYKGMLFTIVKVDTLLHFLHLFPGKRMNVKMLHTIDQWTTKSKIYSRLRFPFCILYWIWRLTALGLSVLSFLLTIRWVTKLWWKHNLIETVTQTMCPRKIKMNCISGLGVSWPTKSSPCY